MKNGWPQKTLADVTEVIAGQSPDGSCYNTDGKGMPFYQGKKEFCEKYIGEPTTWTTHVTRIAREGDVLMSVRAPVGPVNFATREMCIGRGLAAIRSRNNLDRHFLFYFLLFKRDEIEGTEGAVFACINKRQIESIAIATPPLPEQRRIVGILDEAFEAIATAKVNAEKNLQNARALFESHLNAVFTQRNKHWVETTLGAEVDLLTGFPFKSSQYTNSSNGVRLLRGDNIVQGSLRWDDVKKWPASNLTEYERYKLAAGDVVLAMDRPWVKAGLKRAQISENDLPCLLVQRTARIRGNGHLDNRFLVYLISSGAFIRHILGIQTGIGVPHISGPQIKSFRFRRPPNREQHEIIEKLDALLEETQRLKSLYERKLTAIESLKNSLLHQAFTGQLTEGKEVVIATASLPFPIELTGISTTDLHAGILAMAHQLHEEAGRLEHFGHVKAEKIAHMVEARLGISLGRKPVKDAAGPNDFNHLKKVEHRARMTNCFEFKRTDNAAYRVQKLRGFDRLIEKTQTALGNRLTEVEKLLQWMLPMNVQQAEIVATVYAAWNNLLLDEKQPTDDEIVLESRENWHPNKLKIPRDKFFSAVKWLREQGVVPTGKGTRVSANAK